MDELTLIAGSSKSFVLNLVDENDEVEDLSSAQAATLVITDSLVNGNEVLLRKTANGNLTIGEGKLTATITQAEADGLEPGLYIAEVAIRFGATDWFHSDAFYVRILRSVAPHA